MATSSLRLVGGAAAMVLPSDAAAMAVRVPPEVASTSFSCRMAWRDEG